MNENGPDPHQLGVKVTCRQMISIGAGQIPGRAPYWGVTGGLLCRELAS